MPVRTVSDQPYRLQKFKMRLFGASDIRQPDIQVGSSERNIFDEVISNVTFQINTSTWHC